VNRGHTWLMTKREGEFQFRPLRDACNAPRFFGEIE
jgi:hypothetical protein